MEARVPARLSRSEGRRFGLTVGAAFLLLAAVSRWRGHELPPLVLGSLGLLLVLGGLVVPGHLTSVHRAWMGLALAISKVTTPIVMGVLYFLFITPLGVMRRLLGKGAIARDASSDTYWAARPPGEQRGQMEHQF